MISGLKPYAAYKESGLPWLGQVPGHWGLIPNRGLVRRRKVLVGERHGDYRLLSLTKQGVIVRDISTGRGKFSSDMGTSQEVRNGDLVFCLFDVPETPRTVGLSRYDGMITGAYTVLESLGRGRSEYFELFYRAMDDRKLLSPLYSGLRNTIPPERFLGTKTPQPPPDEQAAIVRFLDWANGRLERAIRAKRKVIALLNEQKQAIIHRAVTRGLDPSVPLKPSSIPWLGDIPQHWEVRKLKYEMSFRGGGTPSKGNSAYWNGTIPWVSPKDMKSEVIHDAEDHITERAVAESSTNLVPAGSLLMVVRSGILQRAIPVARCTREVTLNQDMKALTSKGRLDLDYFVLFIRGCEKNLLRVWTKQGATVESVEHQYLANTKVPIPPLPEQQHFVERLASETAPQTTAISRLGREIELLREYRTRLVADVVTGKLDVREAAARLPDEAPLDTVEDDANVGDETEVADEEACVA